MSTGTHEQSRRSLSRVRRGPVLFIIILVAIAAGGLYAATAVVVRVDTMLLPGVNVEVPQSVSRVIPGLNAPPAEGSAATDRITILVLGVDRRPHHDPKVDGPPNSDSMHLVSLDPVTRSAAVLTLPRDLYVEMPNPLQKGEFMDARINSAFRFGEEANYPGGGAAFARRVVTTTFQVPIDYSIVVDWNAFADVIDALGGIEVTVPTELTGVEGFNPRDGNSFTITIPAGVVGMDAVTALAYARYRDDAENDFGRIRRQQQVMRAAADRAGQLGWLGQGPQLYNRFRGAVETDISLAKLPGIVNLARLIGNDRLTTVSLAGEDTSGVRRVITPYGEDVLVPMWEVIGPTLRTVIRDRAVSAENASVTVTNGTPQRDLDTQAVSYLSRFSVPAERISVAPPLATAPLTATTTISYRGDASATARRIADWLAIPASRVSKDAVLSDTPTVSVLLGPDIRLPDDAKFLRYRVR